MKRTKLLLLTVASACMLAALPAHAFLVANGGFETGTLAPWSSTGPDPAFLTSAAANVHSGTWAAQLGPIDSGIRQTVAIVAGTTYLLDFWVKTDGTGALGVFLDSAPGITLNFAGATAYAHYFLSFTPTTSGSLRFAWSDGSANSAFIDDVTLVPEPTTMVAGALLLLPFAFSTVRRLRKNRTA